MQKLFTIGLIAILVIGLITAVPLTHTFAKSKADKSADKAVQKALDKFDSKHPARIAILNGTIKTTPNQVITIYNATKGGVTPPTCPPDKHLENGVCVPNPPEPTGVIPKLNKTTTVRVGTIGDIDNNNGLVIQLNLFKKYQVQYLVIIGDFGYTDGKAVLAKLTAAGFTKDNTVIVLGNHDTCALIKTWAGYDACFGDHFLNDKINIIAIDGNSNFGCGTPQYDTIKSDISSSDAWYNIPAVHQPFVTGPSHHPANGQYQCYQTLFLNNGVDLVLDAHNHNYQRFFMDPVVYLLVGTGTHDSGSSMYSIDKAAQFNGKTCNKCFTGTNGIEILDFKIDNSSEKQINGYFLSNSEKLMDNFTIAH